MRGTRARVVAPAERAAALLDELERHRDYHFRRTPSRRVTGEKSALGFINEVGFCTAFSAGLGVCCLREAIAGEREPALPEHIQHDYAIGLTWEIKDALPAKRLVYYGKAIGGRPSFIAREMLAAFLCLRAAPGGHLKLYRRGHLSHCAKLVMDALNARGPAETRALKLGSGYAQPSRRMEFDRAMKELQEKFLVLKVEERYAPFTYVWDTVENRWPGALQQSRSICRREAACAIIRRYFATAAFGNERALARLFAIEPGLVESAARQIEREGVIVRGVRIAGRPGEFAVLSKYAG